MDPVAPKAKEYTGRCRTTLLLPNSTTISTQTSKSWVVMSPSNKSQNVPGYSKRVQGVSQKIFSRPTLEIEMTLAEVQSSAQCKGKGRQTDSVDKRGASKQRPRKGSTKRNVAQFLDTEVAVDGEENNNNENKKDADISEPEEGRSIPFQSLLGLDEGDCAEMVAADIEARHRASRPSQM
ncbi:hypothetical protein BDV98DRAFT_580881 [Pterulicium gracile]|uniref:Uncharacterized protein n=1 Tax=Pterulicium gracile TaxID=1884261 RepID=A0A5C3QVS0_9AGAR|nr:hypothetical protein BDV98DRAFT_580881 [Pterula gracilis]